MDALAIETKLVERRRDDEQGQRAVQPARQPHHGLSAADGGQSGRETGRLQGEYLVRLAVKRQRQARRQFGRRLDLAGLHGATKIRMVGERTEF